MIDLTYLCTQYGLLRGLAQYLTTIDLFNIALTCKHLNDLILGQQRTFEELKKLNLCDGSGLRARQEESKLENFSCHPKENATTLLNVQCDETGGRPCLKCGVNVCSECRCYPRVGDSYGPCRRPHYSVTYQMYNIIAYCQACDEEVANRIGQEFCECDRYTRWICHACDVRERREASWYYENFTEFDGGGDEEEAARGLMLGDHQHDRTVSYCT